MDARMQSFFAISLDGFSQAELVHISFPVSRDATAPETAAVHEACEEDRDIEVEALGCRIACDLGRILLPRHVVSTLLSLASCFCNGDQRSQHQGQIFGGRRVRTEVSSCVSSFWVWLHPEGARGGRRALPESVIDNVLPAL